MVKEIYANESNMVLVLPVPYLKECPRVQPCESIDLHTIKCLYFSLLFRQINLPYDVYASPCKHNNKIILVWNEGMRSSILAMLFYIKIHTCNLHPWYICEAYVYLMQATKVVKNTYLYIMHFCDDFGQNWPKVYWPLCGLLDIFHLYQSPRSGA